MTPAEQAQQLLSDKLLDLVTEGMRLRYINQWSRASDTVMREKMWVAYNMCADIEIEVRSIADGA